MREGSPESIIRDAGVRRSVADVESTNVARWQTTLITLLQNVLSLQQSRIKGTGSESSFILLDGNTYYVWFAEGTSVLSTIFLDSDLLGRAGRREIDPLMWAKEIVAETGSRIPADNK